MAARLVEIAKDPHSRPGNQNAKKRDENAEVNYPREKKRKGNNGNADPERIIARLKRDAADNPQTQALLDTLNATPQLAGDPAAVGPEGQRNAGGDLIGAERAARVTISRARGLWLWWLPSRFSGGIERRLLGKLPASSKLFKTTACGSFPNQYLDKNKQQAHKILCRQCLRRATYHARDHTVFSAGRVRATAD